MSPPQPLPPTAAQVACLASSAAQVLVCPLSLGSAPSTLPPLAQFVAAVVAKSRAAAASVLVAVSYLEAVRSKLPPTARGLPCSGHRLFLASLILACKYTNDKTYKNKSWVSFCDNLFPVSEINLMERQFLGIVEFDLSFSEDAYYAVLDQVAAYELRIKSLLGKPAKPMPILLPTTTNSSSTYSHYHQQAVHQAVGADSLQVSPPEFHQRHFSPSYLPSPTSTASPSSLSGSSLGSSYGSTSFGRFQPYPSTKRPISPYANPSAAH